LANHQAATDSQPWAAAAAAKLIEVPGSLQPGQSLGPYRIESFLASGGMGEVYRATDTRLHRQVAIKVSSARFSERFEREARVIASLNHPHICQLYDVGPNYLVMELVEGPTLADRIKQCALPPEEALAIARQIAEALEAAHEKGIVHRDLKPANVKITPEGVAKVLDFGLAKAAEERTAAVDPSDSPTQTISATRAGVILGTAAYMSPEQARGAAVDKRADIWAFGCVLYEMLSGKTAFTGETTSDILAAVLATEPELGLTPAHLRPIVEKCLRKDPRKRWCDIGDVRTALEEATPAGAAPVRSQFLPWTVACVLGLALAAVGIIHLREESFEAPPLRAAILPPERTFFPTRATTLSPGAISADGSRIAFSATSEDGTNQLWIRSLNSLAAQPLTGTQGARYPFWSPDNKWLGFFADGKLKKIDPSGGPAILLCDAPRGSGGTWNQNGVIVFAPDILGPLHRVSASGGASSPVTSLDPARNEISHRFPAFLPDGRRFLYTARIYFQGMVRIASLESQKGDSKAGDSQVLTDAGSNSAYSRGYLLFTRGTTLMAQRFDWKRLAPASDPVPIAEHVRFEPNALLSMFSVSNNGLLVYQAGEGGFVSRTLAWFDRGGKLIASYEEPEELRGISLSPDGNHVAITELDGQHENIWILDLSRGGRRTRFTFDPGFDKEPVWSPDGRTIVFASSRRGHFDLYRKSSDGSGTEELLYADNADKHPTSWSADGKFLLYWTEEPKTQQYNLWVLPDPGRPMAGRGEVKPIPFVQTKDHEGVGQFSPNGKWVSYTSAASGPTEILVAPFPGPGGKRQVSASGGLTATWRRDGKELYYIAGGNYMAGGRLMAVDVRENGAALEIGAARPLFGPIAGFGPLAAVEGRTYDVSADGKRILTLRFSDSNPSPQPLTLVQNWPATLKK
jgi:Tol biopolymer transport system component/predicted Ser/Thr protein kinase